MCYLHIQISIIFASLLTQTSNPLFSIDNIKPDATCHVYFLINNLKIL